MGFREPLDLTGIVEKYRPFLGGESTAGVNYVLPSASRPDESGPPGASGDWAIPQDLYQDSRQPGSGDEPERVGAGPLRCSTGRQIAPARPPWAWDPNRYYRDLGIGWPHVHATRKDLREAFFEVGGSNSRRLTYCLKQLLNPATRAEYDALPLGEQYLDDIYIQEAFKKKAMAEASRRSAEGQYTQAQEVLDDWGLKIVPPESDHQGSLDKLPERDNDRSRSERPVGGGWHYAFYLWRTTRWDANRLAEWQSALITELSGQMPTLVVGLMGRQPHRFAIAEIGGDPVVFLNRDEEVTPDLARAATTELLNQVHAQSTKRPTELMKAGNTMSDTDTQTQQVPPHFRKGGDAAQEAAKSTGGNFARVEYLSIEDDGQEVLRYLTDSADWIYVDQHASVPTKNKPSGYEGNWPATMPAVCRYDEAFGGFYKDCYIDDAELMNQWGRPCKPTIRVWALAVLREEVIGNQAMVDADQITAEQVGQRLGYRDQTREVAERDEKGEPTGKTHLEPKIVVVNMAPSNYFNGLNSLFAIYKTVCDRDYVVRKSGRKKDVQYNHVPLDPTPNLHGAYKNAKGEQIEATERWLSKYPQAIEAQHLDMSAIIADKASDDYYARFFDPTKTAAPRKGEEENAKGGSSDAPDAPATADDAVDPEKLAAMRERVRGHAGASSVEDVD